MMMKTAIDYMAQQVKRIDIAMIAAAIVEVPRWYVAFAAIKEPWWAAVPMGILLAWGASAGWKAYFSDKRRWLLLAINVTSLAGALIVIAPVLYAMTFTPLDEINLALIMSQQMLIFWAATLAITTFIPLVQIAAVKMYSTETQTQDANDTADSAQTLPQVDCIAPEIAPQIAQDVTHGNATPVRKSARKTAAKPARKPGDKLTPEQRQAQILSAGLTDASAIVAQFGVSMRTAQNDIAAVRAGMLQTNGHAV